MRRLRHAVSRPCDAICAVLEPSAVLRVVRCGRCCSHIRFCDELIADALSPLPRDCGASAHQLAAADAPCAASGADAFGCHTVALVLSPEAAAPASASPASRFALDVGQAARDVPPRAWCLAVAGRLTDTVSRAGATRADVKKWGDVAAQKADTRLHGKKWLDDRTAAESYSVGGPRLLSRGLRAAGGSASGQVSRVHDAVGARGVASLESAQSQYAEGLPLPKSWLSIRSKRLRASRASLRPPHALTFTLQIRFTPIRNRPSDSPPPPP